MATQYPPWPTRDNKQYRGRIDRIYLSRSESWEVDYYVGQYMKRKMYPDNAPNRAVIHAEMEKYPHPAPILRTSMDAWLDSRVVRKAA